ncbi:phage tail tape measure protein [Pseudomonas syringae group sp. J309-1]|uniref:phage tail tape measure protein n=1 Tax=Pseudomonas syringae group sp. J309-1 TaxID=3079588 RepID=UPI00290C216B|nr:phage tail tape measure protein [Pseudomonas syringae group sp. J309-1]MDU8357978.1 phage tail tape measure protein [Pseudomonas syringae group sp. J309-1]
MADKFQLKALITGVDKLSPKLAGIRKNVAGFKKGLDKTGLGKIGFSDLVTGGALAAPFVAGARAAIDFESQMADVKKVVDFKTPDQFKQMGDDIGRMSERLPMAAGDIAKIVAAGGQSGIAREELLGFAEAAVKMGIAFDQTAEESGDMMAKWRTSFKMTQVDVEGLADKINYLGNTGPANTKQISDIVTRIGPLGAIAGLASGQIAALGATMAGVGIEQEVAATGIKNFMLAMTKGSAATKGQQQAFKALRLNSKAVAKGMQNDAQGTLLDVLKRVKDIAPEKQAGLLTTLFGSESVGAIAPLLTNLDLLESNLKKVTDQKQYSGSMDKEYAARAATTANNLQLMRNAAAGVARAIGNAMLPGINAVTNGLRPLISTVGEMIAANPNLVRGLGIAGAAFMAIRAAAFAATIAVRIMGVAFTATPIGIIAVAIAAAAGLIVANWETVGPFFTALWELIKAMATPFMDFMKQIFEWSPLGVIIRNWNPIVVWFKGMFDKIKPYIEPIMKLMGLEDGGPGLTAKVQQAADAQRLRNAGPGGGDGKYLAPNASQNALANQAANNNAMGIPSTSALLSKPSLPAPGSLLMQSAANNGTKLQGELNINLTGAPPGTRVDQPKTNQPGLTVTPKVGYRTVSAGG